LTSRDTLKPIPGSTRPLSGPATAPAQVEFNPEGDTLVVTEKATRIIDTYTVDENGVADGPVSQPSSGVTPFGFSFNKRGVLIVSEAFGGTANASAVSSYTLRNGALVLRSGSVPDFQSAACWIVVTKNGKFAYTSNTGSNNISSYRVGRDGTLTLLAAVAVATGAAPIDMALNRNSKFLYVLNATARSIDVFRVDRGTGQVTGCRASRRVRPHEPWSPARARLPLFTRCTWNVKPPLLSLRLHRTVSAYGPRSPPSFSTRLCPSRGLLRK
jgi:6-phosphogluconolactonase